MKHPNRAPHNPAFKKVRPSVIKRDDRRCVKCGSSVRIEVHHVKGYTENNPADLQTLCYLCHGVAPMDGAYRIPSRKPTALAAGMNALANLTVFAILV
jgi:5-methylcytosine-specific restriction endonuclease McrA